MNRLSYDKLSLTLSGYVGIFMGVVAKSLLQIGYGECLANSSCASSPNIFI